MRNRSWIEEDSPQAETERAYHDGFSWYRGAKVPDEEDGHTNQANF